VIKRRRIRWARHVARVGERRNVHNVLVEKSEEKRPLGRSWHRLEDKLEWILEK